MCESKEKKHKCDGACWESLDGNEQSVKRCKECYISTETSTHTRRCFMTGEYCSQKTNIQRERDKLYKKDDKGQISVSAFVIMNFSDMSDVVYKWRIEAFIQSLKKYLYVKEERLYCRTEKNGKVEEGELEVKEIKVIRSDSDPASNYVICSRICQQMQIADIVIVDVSSQNPNVFYEFGMAVALQKLILPICFSESFYKMELPEKIKKMEPKKRRYLEHHIGCFPWRKDLFEYYGIRYKQSEKEDEDGNMVGTCYYSFKEATKEKNGFSDIKYKCFPYNEKMEEKKSGEQKIGRLIYEKLRKQYNSAREEDNTLVVYTMEGFLNEEQAGQCIVNFYHGITERLQKEQCFCGERVGVLVQENVIPESDKDTKEQRNLLYNIGEIIHIGVNQATCYAAKAKVMAEDVLKEPDNSEIIKKNGLNKDYREEINRFVKEHIRNRGMIVYPNNPVYVQRIKNSLMDNIFDAEEETCYPLNAFCLYHVMLRTLRHTNEIVVDLTNNCLQSLFWLGAAHGSEIYAVTVRHEATERERKIVTGSIEDKNRNIFDVAGLWTAYYYTHDTSGFYLQLALAQFGIEKHSKIIPFDTSWQALHKWEDAKSDEDETKTGEKDTNKKEEGSDKKQDTYKEKKLALESYYRRRFWNAMLRYNRLRLYLARRDDQSGEDNEPRVRVAKWDIDAVSALTHYLSKRSVIGEYVLITLPDDGEDDEAKKVNFIGVGQPVKPLEKNLPDYISEKFPKNMGLGEDVNKIHTHLVQSIGVNEEKCKKKVEDEVGRKSEIQIKGFKTIEKTVDEEHGMFTYLPWSACATCNDDGRTHYGRCEKILDKIPMEEQCEGCPMWNCSSHLEIAQLILWRDEDSEKKGKQLFRVSIVGSSGPATFGLSSLFVDEGQKLVDHLEEKKSGENTSEDALLYELQLKVRKKIMDILIRELKVSIDRILVGDGSKTSGNDKRLEVYRNLVLYTVHSYLSTVLYRYFFPFTTEKDIHRIYNGVNMFLNSMKVAKRSPFCLDYEAKWEEQQCPPIPNDQVLKIIDMIPKKVRTLLEEFKGLEAFYEVEVTHTIKRDKRGENIKKDIRKVKSIKMCSQQSIHFFVIPSENGAASAAAEEKGSKAEY